MRRILLVSLFTLCLSFAGTITSAHGQPQKNNNRPLVKDSSGPNSTDQYISNKNSPEQNSPEQNSPEQNSPEQKSPEQNSPEQKSPEQNNPEQNSPNKTSPEQKGPNKNGPEPNRRIITRQMPGSSNSSSSGAENIDKIHEDFVVGKVKSVSAPELNQALKKSTGMNSHTQQVEIEVLEGPLKGSSVTVQNELTDNPIYNIAVQPGKEVILSVVTEPGQKGEINIADYHRAPVLITLGVVFLAAFLFLGGKGAFKSLVGLASAIALIGFVLLPLSLHGFNPLLSAACICFVSACVTILCVGGFSKKSLAAALGTVCGVVIAGIAAQLVIDQAPLTGMSSEEAQILKASMMGQPPQFFSGLLAASMLIGALGVIMDVGISIASAVWELSETDRSLNVKQLYEKGMNVGRDIMGSMTSTLVLAYAGSALPLLLLMSTMPSMKLINLDLVASEIAAALTGSLGLVCTIPLTALAAAKFMAGRNNEPPAGRRTRDPFADLDSQIMKR